MKRQKRACARFLNFCLSFHAPQPPLFSFSNLFGACRKARPFFHFSVLRANLMSDSEAGEAYAERASRQQRSCCVCEREGWPTWGRYLPSAELLVPTCGDDGHAVCRACVGRIASEKLRASLSSARSTPMRVTCPFPYGQRSCSGLLRPRVWSRLVPSELVHLRRQLRQQISGDGFQVCCTACGVKSRSRSPEGVWACPSCRRLACGRCDSDFAQGAQACACAAVKQHSLPRGYSRFFSRRLATGGSMPLRRFQVTRNVVEERLAALHAHAPHVHASCPACDTSLYKASACNDLHHCGDAHVCNFCQVRSFPWENGLLEHWELGCPRWDSDITDFPCRDGVCRSEGHECAVAAHAAAISALHAARMEETLAALRADASAVFEADALIAQTP